MDNSPKRRKHKDNPYNLMIENNNYYVLFNDARGIIHKIEISEEVFNLFSSFELDDKKLMNEYDRHIEHNELSELTLNKRAIIKSELVDNIVEKNIDDNLIKTAINNLSDVQKRRIIKYYFYNKTEQEIDDEEGTTQPSVHIILERAKENLKKIIKNLK